MYGTARSWKSSIMNEIGTELSELSAHYLKKNCYIWLCLHSVICIYRPVSTKLGQNIYAQQYLNEFDHGSNWTGTTGVIWSWIVKNCCNWLCLLSNIYKYKPIRPDLVSDIGPSWPLLWQTPLQFFWCIDHVLKLYNTQFWTIYSLCFKNYLSLNLQNYFLLNCLFLYKHFRILTLYHTIPSFITMKQKSFQNILGTSIISFPQCFLPFSKQLLIFQSHLFTHQQMLSIWKWSLICSFHKEISHIHWPAPIMRFI